MPPERPHPKACGMESESQAAVFLTSTSHRPLALRPTNFTHHGLAYLGRSLWATTPFPPFTPGPSQTGKA